MSAAAASLERRRLAALGVERLALRARKRVTEQAHPDPLPPVPVAVAAAVPSAPAGSAIRHLALCPDPAELRDPAVSAMYTALTEAVGKVGLRCVRVCDVAADPAAAVMVFGTAQVPEGVPALRVLRADPLAVLHADRERKRLLWERLQTLGRGEGG